MLDFYRLAARRHFSVAVAVLATVLTACGGGGGGGSEPPADPGIAGSPYFPLSVGSRWRTEEQGSQEVSFVSGTQTISGTVAQVLTTTENGVSSDQYLVKTESGVREIPGPQSDEFTRQIGPYDMVRFPLRTGSSYVAFDKALPPTYDVDGDGRPDAVSVRLDVTVVGFEPVVLPLGSLDNCLRLRLVFVQTWTFSSNGQVVPVTLTSDEWFAADIGPVKSSSRTVFGTQTDLSESTLVTYKVGNKRGGTVQAAPTVVSVLPSGSSAVAPNAVLVVNFSDDIDPASVSATTVRVVGPDGNAVAGAVSWINERSLQFKPTALLSDGSHSVSLLAGVTDLFGAALAPMSTSPFLVDAAAPAVVGLTPAANSLGATAQVAVKFNEPLDTSAPVPAFTLTGPDGLRVPGVASWQDERTLAFVTQTRLLTGAYTSSLAPGVTDQLGNAVTASTQWQFLIDADGPTLVNAVPANGAVEVPITSELRVSFDEPVSASSLSAATAGLYKNGVQVPAGLRAEGNAVVVSPMAPLLRGVTYRVVLTTAVTDTLGNGLRQVVEVEFVTDSGRFALPVKLPALDMQPVARLALADLDGNGTRDLLVVQNQDNNLGGKLLKLARGVEGLLASSAEMIPTSGCAITGVAVADLTGDGKNDVAVNSPPCGVEWVAQGNNGSFIQQGQLSRDWGSDIASIRLFGAARAGLVDIYQGALRLWRPNGASGFLQPEAVATVASQSSLHKFAVGDINGDGRQDVVAVVVGALNPGIMIAAQRADGGFDVQQRTILGAFGPVLIADLDRDGIQELILGDGPTNLRVMRQTASNELDAGELVAMPFSPSKLQLVDYNGDGRLDIVISDANTGLNFRVLLRQANGSYEVTNPFDFGEMPPLPLRSDFLVADFTGDGQPDFLVGQYLIRQKTGASASTLQPSLKQPAATPPKRARILAPLLIQKPM